MFEFEQISAVVLDIADENQSADQQDALADVVQNLLGKGYQIHLLSTKENDDLITEDFVHPALTFLSGGGPPWEPLLENNEGLDSPKTLWVTNHPPLQKWLTKHSLGFAFFRGLTGAASGGVHLGGLPDLPVLLDPTARSLEAITQRVLDKRALSGNKSLTVGIGGPLESGFQEFALGLKDGLESAGLPLINLLDLSLLLAAPDDLESDAFGDPRVQEKWLVEEVLTPLREGRRIFFATMPAFLPVQFEPHFPLFLSEETVLLIIGERLFAPPVMPFLDMSILLEVSPQETTRRLYELPAGEPFDPKFTNQYMEKDGGVYREYFEKFEVKRRASFRIDAQHPGALRLVGES